MSVIDLTPNDEIKTPAIAVYVEKPCSKCKLGRMNATGRAMQPDPKLPPIFEHRCNKCKHPEAYRKQYPTVEFKKIEMPPEVKKENKQEAPDA